MFGVQGFLIVACLLLVYICPGLSILTSWLWLSLYVHYRPSLQSSDLFIAAFCWFLFQSSWVILILYSYECTSLAFLLVVYGTCMTMLLLYVWHMCCRINSIVATLLCMWYVDSYFFIFLGIPSGYIFADPFIGLMEYTSLQPIIYFLGRHLLWFVMISWAVFVGYYWATYYRYIVAVVIGCFLLLSIFEKKQVANSVIVPVLVPVDYSTKPYPREVVLIDALKKTLMRHADALCFVFGESAFSFNIDSCPYFIELIHQTVGDEKIVLLGCYAQCGAGLCNSVIVIQKGKIIQRYCKQHLMIGVESNDGIVAHCALRQTFGQLLNCCSYNNGNDVIVVNNNEYQLFICSELFCSGKQMKALPSIMMWNERWFAGCGWTKHYAHLVILYRSALNGYPIISSWSF